MNFRIESFYNRHLSAGADRVDLVLSVAAEDAAISGEPSPHGGGSRAAVAIIVDMSGSMQGEREEAARTAVRKAVATLDEGTQFFVIKFSTRADVVFGPAEANARNRLVADEAAKRLSAGGGTSMSSALKLARETFAATPSDIRYALFLTDGKNANDAEIEFEREIKACEGLFQCDCRGVGTDWEPRALKRIAERLLGTAEIIKTPGEMEADFTRSIRSALARSTGDVRLRIWTPKAATIAAVKLVSPRIEPLLDRGVRVDAQTIDFPTGAWSPETRDYYIALALPPGDLGEEMLACRPSLVYGRDAAEARVAGGNVVVDWSPDDELSARIDEHVAHYTGQQDLAQAIEEGLEARQRGDVDVATRALGKAARIAAESGNEPTTRRLAKVVDIVDAHEGTVRLKAGVSKADEMDLDLGSTRTARVAKGG